MKQYCISPNASVKSALNKVSKAESGCLVVVDKDFKLAGTLSDGDIRRAILENQDISRRITDIYNTSPFFLLEGRFSEQEIKNYFTDMRYDLIPVLDKDRKVVEILTWSSYFSEKKEFVEDSDRLPVVIMAGGKGKRLLPFTKVLPKPLIPIQDKTVIEHIISKFTDSNLDTFFISINYKAAILKAFFQELKPDYKVKFVEEKEPMGTIGSLSLIKQQIKGSFFVSNCDIILDISHADLINFHQERKNDISLVASAKDYSIPYGTCEINEEGFLKKITEKPSFNLLVNIGLYLLNRDILDLIPEGKPLDAPDLISMAMKQNKKIGVYPVHGDSWVDIGQWNEFRQAVAKL